MSPIVDSIFNTSGCFNQRAWSSLGNRNSHGIAYSCYSSLSELVPFLMADLIFEEGDDQSSSDSDSDRSSTDSDQSSTDSDQSTTHSPIDREEAKDKSCNSRGWGTRIIKDCFETIIALLNCAGDGGGGDSSPGIPYPGIFRVLNSLISASIKLYSYIDSILGYSYLDCLPGWLRNMIYCGMTLYTISGWISRAGKIYQFNIRYLPPAFSKVKHRLDEEGRLDVNPLIEWSNTRQFNNWLMAFHKPYGINHLKMIRRSLGFRLLRGQAITASFLAKAFLDRGLRSIIEGDILTTSMRVATRTFDPISNKYLFYFFHFLVYTGIGVVVWYQIIPTADFVPASPTGFDNDILPEFRDPTSIVEGYRRVSYLWTKDITETVIQTYKNDFLFRDLLPFDTRQESFNGVESKDCIVSLGTALMMAVFITTKTLVLPA
jgi:hypothetical protein